MVDGYETQLDILEELAEHYGVDLTIVLDIFHVLVEGGPRLGG